MDNTGRFLLAIVLMIAVIIGTNLLFSPPPVEREVVEAEAPDPAAPTSPVPAPVPPAEPVPPAPGEPPVAVEPAEEPVAVAEPAPAPDARMIQVESPLYRFGISTAGGAITSAELLRFVSFTRVGPVQLVPDDVGALLSNRLRVGERVIDLRGIAFEAEPEEGLRVEGPEPATLTLRGSDPASGIGVTLTYTFAPNRYLVYVEGRVAAPGDAVPTWLLDLGPTLRVNEEDPREDHRALAYVVNAWRNGISSVRLEQVRAERLEEGPLVWGGIKNKYFLVAALSTGEELGTYFGGLIARPAPGEHEADLTLTLPLSREGGFSYELYMGPQEYENLAAAGRRLEDANPYGWRIFRPIIQPLAHVVNWALVGMNRLLGVGYGWVLILFGVLIRIVLWPLNAKAMRAQLKNMAVQPMLQEIQKKYKDDPQRLQKEMMRLYKEEGFNPLAGCLPMLVPFPVLITLFFVFQGTIEFRGVEFLWLPDLSRPDPFYLLPLLLGASMFALQYIGLRAMPTANPQMKMLMWIMPIVMVIIFANLASGLNLYYLAFNLATLPQQFHIARERQRAQLQLASQPGR